MCAPEGGGSWRLEERSLYSESGGKLGFYIHSPETTFLQEFPIVLKERWLILGTIQAASQRIFIMVISFCKKILV